MRETIDVKYYQHASSQSFAERVLIAARDRVYDELIAQMKPVISDTIVDVGVSDVVTDGANVLERRYAPKSAITACGLGSGDAFCAAFPEVTYRQIEPNVRLPFADRQFAIATANAVLEHVGSPANQIYFVQELSRIADRVFISVPNRFFPIEHHTALPLLHFTDTTFRLGCALMGRSEWAQPTNLILMTERRLTLIGAESGRSFTVGRTGLRLGPFSSNLYLSIR